MTVWRMGACSQGNKSNNLLSNSLNLSRQIMQLYGNGKDELEPADLARCMIDTYRGMNKHFIPTGYELSSFARVFDQSKKGRINAEDVLATASRMFLAN